MAEKTSNPVLDIINQAILDKRKRLDLSRQSISVLPKEIGHLTEVEEIDLSRNEIEKLPKQIKNLQKLKRINLYKNHLQELPVEIGELKSLQELNLSKNALSQLPDIIGNLHQLEDLFISENKLEKLPENIGNLSNLRILLAGDNELSFLPESIQFMENLLLLDVGCNRFEFFPPQIFKLKRIEALILGGDFYVAFSKSEEKTISVTGIDVNTDHYVLKKGEYYQDKRSFKEIPSDIASLKTLKRLDLSWGQVKSLPVELKDLKLKYLVLFQTELGLPPEILKQYFNPSAILSFYFDRINRPRKTLNESKILIIGQGSVGKTSLVRRITENNFDSSQSKTDGISIKHWQVENKLESENRQSQIKLNIWDFGGQEIMHATHQFFFTKRSLYILVLDSRLTQEENRVEYWLKTIQSFGGESPVLLIGNKIDQHPIDIDRTGLQKKYPNIIAILETSAATGAGIDELKAAIVEQVNNLPHVRDLLPENWFTVKTELESLGRNINFIAHDKYLELCKENEIEDEISQHTLIGFLHDLGIVIYFQDDRRLSELGILNPLWVTNGVYKILNSQSLFKNKGVLTVSMLDDILNLPEYPRGKRLFIVDMMKKFELCYDIEPDKTFLVPDLLPKDEPAELKFNGVPAFEYAYPVLPSSVITRFIVRMNQKIDDGLVWRTGVVLKIGNNTALVKADIEDRKIIIAIDGLEHTRRDALSAIRTHLDDIHNSIKGLNPEKFVPVPGADKAKPLPYSYLLMLEAKGIEILPVQDGDRLVEVNIRQVLSGVESEAQRKANINNVTNYYIAGGVSTGGGDFTGRDKSISASNGSVVVGRDVDGNLIAGDDNRIIQDSYNKIKSADIQPELKETLKQLVAAVETMNESLPEEQSAEVTEDLRKLVDEAIKPKPNKKWYSVSIEGLIKAAENLDKLGEPVIKLSRKVLSILTAGIIK
jgi:internalin A